MSRCHHHPAARWLQPFVDLLYPRSCAFCGEGVEGDVFPHLCDSCVGRVRWVRPPACATCGHPFFGEADEDRVCPHCLFLRPAFGTGCTGVLVRGPVRALVHGLKYRGQIHLLRDMREILSRAEPLRAFLAGAVLVPVPLHPRKRRERGFNQSLLLAETLAGLSEATEVEEGLVKTADTESQTLFDREKRLRNLKNAFAISPDFSLIRRKRYVLIDDVFTTGSTLNACARVLRRRGANRVDVATFGHG